MGLPEQSFYWYSLQGYNVIRILVHDQINLNNQELKPL